MRYDTRGATVVEFALVAAPLIALLLAILVTSLTFMAQQALETTAEGASRLIMTGQAQTNNWTAQQFQTQACRYLPSFMDCSKLMIDVETASSFSSISTAPITITYDPKTGKPNNLVYKTGGAGDIVVLRLIYMWPVVSGPLGFNLSNSGNSQRMLFATSVAKTEPYTS